MPPVPKARGGVRFDTISIREHPIILGDNPGGLGTRGPPLSIDWTCDDETTLSVDDYEASRPQRRTQHEMVIPAEERKHILRRTGYTSAQIVAGTKPVNIVRNRRSQSRTRESLAMQPISELVERISSKTESIVTLGVKKRREREFLAPYQHLHTKNQPRSSSKNKQAKATRNVSAIQIRRDSYLSDATLLSIRTDDSHGVQATNPSTGHDDARRGILHPICSVCTVLSTSISAIHCRTTPSQVPGPWPCYPVGSSSVRGKR